MRVTDVKRFQLRTAGLKEALVAAFCYQKGAPEFQGFEIRKLFGVVVKDFVGDAATEVKGKLLKSRNNGRDGSKLVCINLYKLRLEMSNGKRIRRNAGRWDRYTHWSSRRV